MSDSEKNVGILNGIVKENETTLCIFCRTFECESSCERSCNATQWNVLF